MNIRRYISTLLLLFGCIITLSAEVMTNSSFNKSDGETSAENNALKQEQEYLNQLRQSK